MATTIPTITQISSGPSRTAPKNFDSAADQLLGIDLPTMTTELQTTIPAMNTAIGEAEGYQDNAENYKDDAELAETVATSASQTALSAASETQSLIQSAVQDMADSLAATANATVYIAGITFAAGDIAFDPTDSYRLYTSQQNANTGHLPSTDDGTWWLKTLGDAVTTISLNKNTIDSAFVISNNYNALSVGPIDINATVTVNSTWEII